MIRWNNFPRIENISYLDNLGFVIHVALFLAYLEEKNGKKIDKVFLIKRIIFSSLSRLILSDINSGTKDYINSIDEKIFSELEAKALDKIFSLSGPDFLTKDIKETLDNTSNDLEMLIISSAKKYVGFKECTSNYRVYPEVLEKTYNIIKQDLELNRKKLKSLDELMGNEQYSKYLSHICGLSHSIRWNQEKRIFPISVMAHMVYVTFISYIIWGLENSKGNCFDLEELLLKSIYHDIPEAITGDIITPTKKAIPGFVNILEKVEVKMMDDYLFSNLPLDYKDLVSPYMLDPFSGELGKIAKFSDIFSALFESKIEVNNGSENFRDMYFNIKKKVNSFGLYSTDYLIKYGSLDFDENIKISL